MASKHIIIDPMQKISTSISNTFTDNADSDAADLSAIFDNDIPTCVQSLLYNLRQLNKQSDTLFFNTVGIIYLAFVKEIDYKQRVAVFRAMIIEVENAELDTRAILAFLCNEPHGFLVRQAVSAYLQYKYAPLDEPFVATQDIISIIKKNGIANRGAAFAGLITFNDRRVCAVARTIRDTLSQSDIKSFSQVISGPLKRSTLEFCLIWLVDLVDSKQEEKAAEVAFALAVMVVANSTTPIHDIQFNFGPFGFPNMSRYPDIEFTELVTEFTPILDFLSKQDSPALSRLVDMFKNPEGRSLDVADMHHQFVRRDRSDRRADDRRVIDIRPRIERRRNDRRETNRRSVNRA